MPAGRMRLGAALFNADHTRLGEELNRVEQAGLDFVHLDVFDGHFVPDLGFPPRTIAALRPLTHLPFQVHLGVSEPLRIVPHLAEAGVNEVLVHIESFPLLYEGIIALRDTGMSVGLALTLGTPLAQLEPVLSLIDAVLLLSRVTGEGTTGAHFNPLVLPRVREVGAMATAGGFPLDIQVAGGVNRTNIVGLMQAGATAAGLGAGIYRVPDMVREVADLRELLVPEA